MPKEFAQATWDQEVEHDLRQLIRMAILEDLEREFDWTTVALVPAEAQAAAAVVARQEGCLAGIMVPAIVFQEMASPATWSPQLGDGGRVDRGTVVGVVSGPARDLLTAERTLLNFLGRLSGIATQTARYVDRIQGLPVKVYDTRKTTPGFRRLEKFAVRQGGGHNHRCGLHEAILIKDNHLALGQQPGTVKFTPAEAVELARSFARTLPRSRQDLIIEVEIDSLELLEPVLRAGPDIVLCDNFAVDQLRAAVLLRDAVQPTIELEASGGITLETIRAVAETGVNRISSGALTHSAPNFDVALDWIL